MTTESWMKLVSPRSGLSGLYPARRVCLWCGVFWGLSGKEAQIISRVSESDLSGDPKRNKQMGLFIQRT